MKFIIQLALYRRWFVISAALIFSIWGLILVRNTKLDVFPEFSLLSLEIQTECPGLSAIETESLVTTPIEISLSGITGMITTRSKSLEGLSSVLLLFEDSADLTLARQLIQERLTAIKAQLPVAAKTPVLLVPKSSLSRVLKIGVTSKSLSQTELTTLVRWNVWPRLMAVSGVAHVGIWGQRDRQFQVLIDPAELQNQKVTLAEIVKATQDILTPTAGGYLDTPNQRLSITHTNSIEGVQDLKRIPIAFRNGVSIPLERLATVIEGHQQPIGDAIVNGQTGLLLIIEKQLGANTLSVTHDLENVIESVRGTLGDVEFDSAIFRPATFIETAVKNLKWALLLGCILVGAILLAFLFEWRITFISLTAIPLSLITAATVFHLSGVTFNTMIIAGLAIALGEVVDDAIIDVENIVRRLRLNRLEESPKPTLQVILEASIEVRSAVVYATLIVTLVFVPVLFLGGVAGKFFTPLAAAYVLSVSASLLVALTVTPALCSILLSDSLNEPKEFAFFVRIRAFYRRILFLLLDRSKHLLAGLVAAFTLSGVIFSQLGEELLPKFKEFDFLMHWVGRPGTSIDAMRRTALLVSNELKSIPEVQSSGVHIGRAEASDEIVGSNFAELWLSLRPGVNHQQTIEKLRGAISNYPGIYHDVLTYLSERIEEVISGGKGSIVIRIYGEDLSILRMTAQEVHSALSAVNGVSDLQIEPQIEVPHIEINLEQEAAANFGLNAGDIKKAIYPLVHGLKVGEIFENQKTFDVVLWTKPELRVGIETLSQLLIDAPGGGKIPLKDVATLKIVGTPNIIQHEAGSRKIDVSLNSKGRNLGQVARDTESIVSTLKLPSSYRIEILGEYKERRDSQNQLLFLSLLSLLGIFIVLLLDFRSFRIASLIFLSLPFALLGGVIASTISGAVISLGSLVGFVTVLGIAARNTVMLVSHYRFLEEEGLGFGKKLILQGSEERLRPILMTAMATGIGLLPIVIGGDKPGHEIEYPMAVIILGGLMTSTFLNLAVMPSLTLAFLKSAKKEF